MTSTWTQETEPLSQTRAVRVAKRPISFEAFLRMTDENDSFELLEGALVPKMAAQYPHENRFAWLLAILRIYVSSKGLGVVLGSRSAIEIDEFRGRIPDILFIRSGREQIIQDRAIYGAPDLVVEIVSASNSAADIVSLEADYCHIGVAEIVFWHPEQRKVVVLRKRDSGYSEETLSAGEFRSESVPGLHLDLADMFSNPLPGELDILNRLLAE
jgi:Uma2 family endonuclease